MIPRHPLGVHLLDDVHPLPLLEDEGYLGGESRARAAGDRGEGFRGCFFPSSFRNRSQKCGVQSQPLVSDATERAYGSAFYAWLQTRNTHVFVALSFPFEWVGQLPTESRSFRGFGLSLSCCCSVSLRLTLSCLSCPREDRNKRGQYSNNFVFLVRRNVGSHTVVLAGLGAIEQFSIHTSPSCFDFPLFFRGESIALFSLLPPLLPPSDRRCGA